MKMSLSEQFDSYFLSTSNPFAESVSYTVDGVTTQIKALVKRGGFISNKMKSDNTKSLYDFEVVLSIADVTKVTVNKDTVTLLAPQYGVDATNTYIVSGIIGKTPMAWHLGLRG